MARKIEDAKGCENGECENKATDMVYSRHKKEVIFCCEACSDIVIDEDSPEYWNNCENCGCRQGVN